MARAKRRAALMCAPFLSALIVILAQLGMVASAWDLAPRESGPITYAIDPAIGANGMAGARDALFAWAAANDGMSFREAAWSDADVRIGRMDTMYAGGQAVMGCACLGLWPGCPAVDNAVRLMACPVPDGATIGSLPEDMPPTAHGSRTQGMR